MRLSYILIVLGLALVARALAGCTDNRTPVGDPDERDVVFDCLPDLDGRIDAAEMPVALGTPIDYYVSPSGREIDLAGAVDDRGVRIWDLSTEYPDDDIVAIAAEPIDGKWYAGSFPGGQFVFGSDLGGELDGIYHKDDEGLWLHGLASRVADPPGGQTLLVYEQPVALLRFPLEPGDLWTEVGTVRDGGTIDGLPHRATDTYEVEVDGSGEILLPYVRFEQALRVRTRVVIEPEAGNVVLSQRQASFLFECFGEVARATSRQDETEENFSVAEELRRLAF